MFDDITPLFPGEPLYMIATPYTDTGYLIFVYAKHDEEDPTNYWIIPDDTLVAKLMPGRVNLSHGSQQIF